MAQIYSYIRILVGEYSNIETFQYEHIFYRTLVINNKNLNIDILSLSLNYP